MTKVFLLTDSRGVHKPAGSQHAIYSERLARVPGLAVTSYLCPFQWTTIPDFLHLSKGLDLASYDHVILHAGIVDHSPRPLSQARARLYEPTDTTDAETVKQLLAKRKFTDKKVINRKRDILDDLFSAEAMATHLAKPFAECYEGEPTINLYSMEMMLDRIVPRLKSIENLVFIGSNDFCPGWNGDFPKTRPSNIRIIEDYSRALCRELPNVVNLHQWTPEQVREFTCDNLHLSAAGSNWLFLRLLEALRLRSRDYMANRRSVGTPLRTTPWPLHADSEPERIERIESIKLDEPSVLAPKCLAELQRRVGRVGLPLATLVIGFRIQKVDPSRLDNLRFLMGWINRFYGEAFELLLVEQDVQLTENLRDELSGKFRYEFLYNPEAYNRGWLYNVAVKHFTDCPVVGFCDTDILPGANFLDCVIGCYEGFDAVSPNRNLYYSTLEQKQQVLARGTYAGIPVTEEALKNPTSFSGGMLVVNRQKFLDIGGFEQYVGYGCEDRALDVTMLALLPPSRVGMDSHAYFHLHHPSHATEHVYFNDIYGHMVEHYGCEYTRGLKSTSYIHANCCHESTDKVHRMAEARAPVIGDPRLYRDNSFVTINGLPPTFPGKLIPIRAAEPTFPPAVTNLGEYIEREEFLGRYVASWAPAVPKDSIGDDTAQLAFFYNRFKGKRCFIIGNGPSLNKHDLSLLEGEYTFAVNSFYYKTRETGFRPTFFVVEDSSVIKENQQEIMSYEAPFKFFPSIYRSLHPKAPGTYFFKLNRGFYEKSSPNYAIPRFSSDITKTVYCGQSVTYVNLQLAFFMGFTEVFLIGMDFNYEIPSSHQRTGDVLLSDTDDLNHFHKDYFGKGKTWKDPKLDRVLMNYKMAKLVFECAGRKIFNATIGGKLEVFERVNYEGLFRGFGQHFAPQALDLTRPPEPSDKLAASPTQPPAVAPKPPPAAAKPAVQQPSRVTAPQRPSPAAPPANGSAHARLAAQSAPEALVSGMANARSAPPDSDGLLPGDSISEANCLFLTSEFEACAQMCKRLHTVRGLRMYKELADLARQRLAAEAV